MREFAIFDWRVVIGTQIAARRGIPAGSRESLIEKRKNDAFSLVEVTLALGIISFALIAVLGLLPVGLRSVKNANDQAGAANVLNAIAGCVRSASSTNSVDYTNTFSGQSITFSVGGAAVTKNWNNLKLDGSLETASDPKRISAIAIITPPANATTTGRGVISVAWSAQANPIWDAGNQTWTKADGSITSGMQFLPKP